MSSKPEVNLEVSAGFFRLTAPDAVYNITVLNGSCSAPHLSAVPAAPALNPSPPDESCTNQAAQQAEPVCSADDDYYKQVSTELYHDIGNLAKSLSATMMDIPMEDRKLKRVELDEAGEKIEDAKSQLQDIVEMTEQATMEIMDSVEHIQSQTNDVKELLSFLKDHRAFLQTEIAAKEERESDDGARAEELAKLKKTLTRALDLVAGAESGSEPDQAAVDEVSPPARYSFEVDTFLQTMYELCTNETVKGHISTTREKAAELFDLENFREGMNQAVSGQEPDGDNFFTLSLSEVLAVLIGACSDKKIQNLFKKMDAGQAEIFLDGNLPVEAPPRAETAESKPSRDEAAPPAAPPLAEVGRLLEESLQTLDQLPATPPPDDNRSQMSLEDQEEIFAKIADAFHRVSNIAHDVQKITEALSFQDLSGQQIMKIIKLLSDFQVQLLAIVVSFGSQLKLKEQNAGLTHEESKKMAQGDVDAYFTKINAPEDGAAGLDQDTVNRMLEEMGF